MDLDTARTNAELLQIGNQGIELVFDNWSKLDWFACILISTGVGEGPSIRAVVVHKHQCRSYETDMHSGLAACLDELSLMHLWEGFPLPILSNEGAGRAERVIGVTDPQVLRQTLQVLLAGSHGP